jgi:hypothetical protein
MVRVPAYENTSKETVRLPASATATGMTWANRGAGECDGLLGPPYVADEGV